MELGTYPCGDTLLELRVKPEGGDKMKGEGGVSMVASLADSGRGRIVSCPFPQMQRKGIG